MKAVVAVLIVAASWSVIPAAHARRAHRPHLICFLPEGCDRGGSR